jgi:tRNA(fMet)-specific endonuclease VapC
MAYLLDTGVLTALIRDPAGPLVRRIAAVGERQVATSVIVAGELRYAVEGRGSARLRAAVDLVLEGLEVLPLEPGAERHYGEIRRDLERLRIPFGANDLWIAAHTRAGGHVLVTTSDREFRRIKGLLVENWLVDPPLPGTVAGEGLRVPARPVSG